MRIAGLVVTFSLFLAGLHGPARADTAKAWAAAKAGLPADTRVVLGFDIAALRKTQLFATYFPKLRDSSEAAKVLDAVKDTCKLDPVAVVQGIVVAMSSDPEDGAAYVALSGVDRTKLSSCLQAILQAEHKDTKITVKQDHAITEITKDDDHAFLGWVGKDVIVVALHAQDRPALVKWMGGKGAFGKSDAGKIVTRVNTAAAIWGAGLGDKELEPGIAIRGAHGAITYARTSLALDLHAMTASAGDAAKLVEWTGHQLDQIRQAAPAAFGAVLKSVTAVPDKDEVRITATMDEKEVLAALALASSLGGP